ncbi:MAG: hypothetical protein AAFN80_14285, partial [Pseudomonadota bacterium]
MLHVSQKSAIWAAEMYAEAQAMSDNWILIVPKLPKHVPSPDNAKAALKLLENSMPNAEEIEIVQ